MMLKKIIKVIAHKIMVLWILLFLTPALLITLFIKIIVDIFCCKQRFFLLFVVFIVYFVILYVLRADLKKIFLDWDFERYEDDLNKLTLYDDIKTLFQGTKLFSQDEINNEKPMVYPTVPDVPEDIQSLMTKNACMITKFYNKQALIDSLNFKDIQIANWDVATYTQDAQHIFISPQIGQDVFFFGMLLETFMNHHPRYGGKSTYFKHISNFDTIDELFLFFSVRTISWYGWIWIKNGRIKRSFIFEDGNVIEEGEITPEELIVKAKIEKEFLQHDEQIGPYDWVYEDAVTDIMCLWCESVNDLKQLPPSTGEVVCILP